MTTDLVKKSRKLRSGAALYSPWYSEEFELEKLSRDDRVGKFARGELGERETRRFGSLWNRLSESTRKSYQGGAIKFGKYLGIPKAESTPSKIIAKLIALSYLEAMTLVEEYLMWMDEEKGLAPNTINLRLASLKWLVDSARKVGWVEWSLDVKGVKPGNVRDTSGPSESEFRRIIRSVNDMEGATGARTRAIVYLLAFTGVRIGSAVSLDMENLSVENTSVRVKWKGKGDSRANYIWRPIGKMTLEAILGWLEFRGRGEGPVFTSTGKGKLGVKRLTIRQAQKNIEDVGRLASTEKRLTPHAFRHFFATDNLRTEDTRQVMKATGHTNIKTIERYDDSGEGDARGVMGRMEERWLEDLDVTKFEDEMAIGSRGSHEDEYDPDEWVDSPESRLERMGIVSSADIIESSEEDLPRISTGIKELNYLFGGTEENGGMVEGSLVLIGGKRGLGKSTLVRQICYNVCKSDPDARVLYGSSEETPEQITSALRRINCWHERFYLCSKVSINDICEAADEIQASLVVIDSVSRSVVDGVKGRAGSITQVKSAGQFMLNWCKGHDGSGARRSPVLLIAHVTSTGEIAGPKEIEHHVDAIYNFRSTSNRSSQRSLDCEGKNRFGDSTRQIYMDMTSKGLVAREVVKNDDYSVFEDEDYSDEVRDG
jgi:integrase